MSRKKKNSTPLNMKVDSDIMEKFNQYCEEVGQTKTLAFERIVTEHLERYYSKQNRSMDLYNKNQNN